MSSIVQMNMGLCKIDVTKLCVIVTISNAQISANLSLKESYIIHEYGMNAKK